jgi:signal transduction histidine kinase
VPAAGRLLAAVGLACWAVAVAWSAPLPVWGTAVGIAGGATTLLGARYPVPALAGAFGAMMAAGALPSPRPDDPYLAILVVACYSVGRHARLAAQPWAAAAVLLLLTMNLVEPGRNVSVADAVFPVVFTAAPWLLGLAVQLALNRERRALDYARTIDESRAEAIRQATLEERLRIAREVHDEVAHSISALSLQAQVARRAAAAGGTVAESELRTIEETAQGAMDDLRRLLGLLRPEGDRSGPLSPQPDLRDVTTLVQEARAAGQEVRLQVVGEPEAVPPSLGAAAYRILQEALTNARRHGTGAADVVLRHQPGEVVLEVVNPIDPARAAPSYDGHGLVGMRERVALFGGGLDCGPCDGAWRVRAVLPAGVGG